MNKKSYMDHRNILSEGFFSSIKSMFKFYKEFKAEQNRLEKEAKVSNDPEVKEAWAEVSKHYKKVNKDIESLDKGLNDLQKMFAKSGHKVTW